LQRKGRLDYTKIIKTGLEHGVRIHGFAMNKKARLDIFPFYSTDSISWKAICMYGISARLRDKGLYEINRRGARVPESRSRLLAREIKAWNDFEDYYTALWTKRGVEWTT
jgi:hypothetical protein